MTRRSVTRPSTLAVWLAAWFAGPAAAGPVKFYVTQPLPGSYPVYECSSMSADGRTAVGWINAPFTVAYDQAWVLTPCSTVLLPDLGTGGYAYGASDNAAVVVGSILTPVSGIGVAARWDAPGYAFTMLPTLGGASAHASAITPDGGVIVGWSVDTTGQAQGSLWIQGGPPIGVGNIAGFTFNGLVAVAADGSAAVGHAQGTSGVRALWFRPGLGLAFLPNPPGGVFTYAFGVSNAPNLVVGMGTIGTSTRAMLSDGVNTVSLGTLPGHNFSRAYGISPDGSVIIGNSSGPGPALIDTPFIYVSGVGMVDLQAWITGTLGYTGLGPWQLVTGQSAASGLRAFAGTARNNLTGYYAGYLIKICPADFNRDGVTDLQDFAPFVAAFNAGDCEADLDEDGLFTSNDHTHFFNSVASGC